MEFDKRMRAKKDLKVWKIVIQGLPLAGAAGTVFLPLQRMEQQFVMLIVLLWIQAFFISEVLLNWKKHP
jgi:hypothetical protein